MVRGKEGGSLISLFWTAGEVVMMEGDGRAPNQGDCVAQKAGVSLVPVDHVGGNVGEYIPRFIPSPTMGV